MEVEIWSDVACPWCYVAAAHGKREAMVERLFRSYFTDGEALGEPAGLVRLAAEVGLDADGAREMLQSAKFADEVRADEERARQCGITGVPFFAIDERYGVSGAQPPEALLGALRQAWEESAAEAVNSPAADGCEDGSCAV